MQALSSSTTLSEQDRHAAATLLDESRSALHTAAAGLTDAQWRFRPEPAVWSPGDIVEHLVKSEQAVYQLITMDLVKRPVLPPNRRSRVRDLAIVMAVTNRDVRFTAAEMVRPTSAWTSGPAMIAEFDRLRARTKDYLAKTMDDLRGRTADHPVLGVIDAYQWILFVAAHSERHSKQMVEVRARG